MCREYIEQLNHLISIAPHLAYAEIKPAGGTRSLMRSKAPSVWQGFRTTALGTSPSGSSRAT